MHEQEHILRHHYHNKALAIFC